MQNKNAKKRAVTTVNYQSCTLARKLQNNENSITNNIYEYIKYVNTLYDREIMAIHCGMLHDTKASLQSFTVKLFGGKNVIIKQKLVRQSKST